MSDKNGFNFSRKIWHVLGLIIPVSLYLDLFRDYNGFVYASRAVIVTYLGIFLFLLVILESIRLTSSSFEAFFFKHFGFLMKESERTRFNGTVPYFFANFLVVLFFPPEIAVLSILFLVVGDPTAAYVGSKYGKNRFYNGKSREGIIGFFVSTFVVGLIVLFLFTISKPESFLSLKWGEEISLFPVLILALGVLAACLTEFFSSTVAKGLIDDNLLIPIVSSIVISFFSFLFLRHIPSEFFFSPFDLYLQK